jgi:hypothetical protein
MNGAPKGLPSGSPTGSPAGLLVGAVLASCLATSADADAAASDRPQIEIRAGATFFDADASLAAVRQGVPSLGFSVDDLGIDDGGARFFASAIWRVTDRWMVQFDTFGFDSRGGRTGTLEVAIGDLLVESDVVLEGSLDLDLYALNVGYRLIDRGGFEAGVGVGFHYVSLDYGVTASTLPEQGAEELAALEGSDDFPAPNLYGWASWRFDGNLRGDLTAGWLSVETGDFDGRIYFLRASMQYGFSEYVAIGAGYWITDFDVDRETSARVDNYDVRLRGPQLYLNLAF